MTAPSPHVPRPSPRWPGPRLMVAGRGPAQRPALRAASGLLLALAASLGGCAHSQRQETLGGPPAETTQGAPNPDASNPGAPNVLDTNLERPDYPYKSGPPSGVRPAQ